jgi:hypothetical protein
MSKKPRTGYNPLENFLPQIKDSREENPEVDESAEKEKPEKEKPTKPKAKTNAKTISQTKLQPVTHSQTYSQTSAAGIKEKAVQGAAPYRLEDNRKRQTYWLDPDEIKMISEISKKAGVGKYLVVSAAVRMLYEYVFETEKQEN